MKSQHGLRLLSLASGSIPLLVAATLLFAPQFAGAQATASQAGSPAAKSASQPATTAAPNGQKTFSSPQQAAQALYDAASNDDENAIIAILGPNSRDLVMWTPNADDRKADIDQFVTKYKQMHRFVKEPDSETTLYVGAENWPMPIPLVNYHGAWYFDTPLGRQEVLYRRIGENEMDTIDVLRQLVDAENEYSSSDSNSSHAYALHFASQSGNHNGLYWQTSDQSEESPIGPAVAHASYNHSDRVPFHGYFFRILTEQGPHAMGGAKNYLVDGNLTGGFAFVALPAEYRSSGVKTFMVDKNGVVYEKDLGAQTAKIDSTMKSFDPGAGWTRVQEMSAH
jgi:hypothetical protein